MAWPSSSARTKNWGTELLTDSDQETQFDILHTYLNDSLNGSTGHGHTGGTSDGPKLSLTAAVSGTLPIANGGTNITSYTAGDVLYASGTTTLTKLAKGTAFQRLRMNAGATAPEWATAINYAKVTSATRTGITSQIPYDDSIPQSNEGTQVLTQSITPLSATSVLKIEVCVFAGAATGDSELIAALFQDATANALAVGSVGATNNSSIECIAYTYYMTSGTTSSTTFAVNLGANSGNCDLNGTGGARKFGGVLISSLTITELAV